jgi:hypothetical protein
VVVPPSDVVPPLEGFEIGHFHPFSISHEAEQPSPSSVFSSSHASPSSIVPLPHSDVLCSDVDDELAELDDDVPPPVLQVLLQPSPFVRLPSSHCSGATLMPSPQMGAHNSAPSEESLEELSEEHTSELQSP